MCWSYGDARHERVEIPLPRLIDDRGYLWVDHATGQEGAEPGRVGLGEIDERVDRGGDLLAAAEARVGPKRLVPAFAAASVMNSPACSAAQNGCTTSGTCAVEN